ncbi:DUF7455 domain-containing protein [Agrococcus casei]|uniref:DUF7455 domain-containing protein n=1 Tax=Agrococcus casei LMG 22410 TaxID=1255656 RepID=A0A1R4FNW6_9MICO|nr:hypothetical protein [Agrococcus casei]SJM57616.1 hypothetical protein CZ674_05610 [Agrococcus casei LMG 22410]
MEQTVALEHDHEATAPLSALDRCDSCGAQAYVRVTMASGPLLFCAHHASKHKSKLHPMAEVWHDESDKLVGA